MTKIIPEYIKNHLVLDSLTSSLPLLRFIDTQGTVTQADAAAFNALLIDYRLDGAAMALH